MLCQSGCLFDTLDLLVAVVGLGFATLKVRGIGVGVTGVLFAGLGHFGFHLEHHTLGFCESLGSFFSSLPGLQIGPGFFASLRDKGLALNGLAAGIVIGGGIMRDLRQVLRNSFRRGGRAVCGATTNTRRSAQPSKRSLG